MALNSILQQPGTFFIAREVIKLSKTKALNHVQVLTFGANVQLITHLLHGANSFKGSVPVLS
jgi:hypothetical protein